MIDLFRPFRQWAKNRRKLIVPCGILAGGLLLSGQYWSRVLNPDGTVAVNGEWRPFNNGTTTLGLNYLLNTGFRGTAQSSSWYAGLINETGFTALAAADTSASHAGWTEITAYSGNRPAWAPAAASSGSVAVASALSFTATSSIDVRGAFLANSNTKSSAVDLIYSTAVESTFRTIAISGTYQLYYTVTLTPA